MEKTIRAAVLGAGLGSRLRTRAKAKPLASLAGKSLLAHLISRLKHCGITEIHCALREELLSQEDKDKLPREAGLSYLFVNTESSLHTLVELIRKMGGSAGPVLFTMADTVLQREDLAEFVRFCRGLPASDNAILLTSYVDDENPLWAHLKENGSIEKLSAEPAQHITSGLYFLQPEAMEIAQQLEKDGVQRMRNFLTALADRGFPIKTFVVSKTIDVDHPSDLDKAADFLHRD
jgi:NDP-sugar pyrophosphorylase family protein